MFRCTHNNKYTREQDREKEKVTKSKRAKEKVLVNSNDINKSQNNYICRNIVTLVHFSMLTMPK